MRNLRRHCTTPYQGCLAPRGSCPHQLRDGTLRVERKMVLHCVEGMSVEVKINKFEHK